jgi:hypothetical protein
MTPGELRRNWAERDRRYATGTALALTDAQVEGIRQWRHHEATEAGAPEPMRNEAIHWTPPPITLGGGRWR